MSAKKIVHIITRLDPGGSAENTVLSVERVDRERFSSLVLTGTGIHAEGVPGEYRERLGDRLLIEPMLLRPVRPFQDFRCLFRLIGWIRRLRPELLHLHSAKAGALGRLAARMAGRPVKVIYTPHGHVFSGYGDSISNRIFTIVEKWLASSCHAIVGLTPDEIEEFHAHHAGKKEQYCIVPSGVLLEQFSSLAGRRERMRAELSLPQEAYIVGFIGRLAEVKGPDLFLKVAKLIYRKNREVRFLIVGDGEMRASLEQWANDHGLSQVITWTGWRKDLPAIYDCLDGLVMTSRNEGQGRVAVEAMAAGKPVVTMDSGGVSHVVEDGVTGYVTELYNTEQTAESVLKLLNDPSLREQMGNAGRKRAELRFSVEVMIERLNNLYSGLLSDLTPEEIFRDESFMETNEIE